MKVISLIILGCASSIVVFGAQIKNETEVKNATLVLPDKDAVDDIVYNVNATQGAGIDDIDIDDKCITCLCQAATGCDLKYGCKEGYCGPFRMSRVYWIDAGKLTLPNDDTDRIGAYQDCAISYPCAVKVVKAYLAKFGRDCNGDGITDCRDYAMINANGAWGCETPLTRNTKGREYLDRLEKCFSGKITNS